MVAEADGTLWASDGRGGVTRIDPDGGQALLAGWGGEPNGLAIDPDGNLVTANIALGMVQRMTRDDRSRHRAGGGRRPAHHRANFVFYDRSGRLWVTCLTREDHWWPAVAAARTGSSCWSTSATPIPRIVTASTPPTRPGWTPRSATCTWPRP